MLKTRKDFRLASALAGFVCGGIGYVVAILSTPLAGAGATAIASLFAFFPLEYLRAERAPLIPNMGPFDAGLNGATVRVFMLSAIVFAVSSAVVVVSR